jgi:hypothetical protein
MADNTIAIPAGVTTGEQLLAFVAGVVQQQFGTPGTIVKVTVGSQFIGIQIITPVDYKPSNAPPPLTVDNTPWVPPPTSVAPPAEFPWQCAVFQGVLAASINWYWGSPIATNNGGVHDCFLMGGSINGVPVMAKSTNYGNTWSIVSYPAFVIQQMVVDAATGVVVGRGAGQSNFLQSTDYGVTWTAISDSPEFLGTAYHGFYG